MDDDNRFCYYVKYKARRKEGYTYYGSIKIRRKDRILNKSDVFEVGQNLKYRLSLEKCIVIDYEEIIWEKNK